MDSIQKALIEAGRKDLAQVYYQKIAKKILEVEDSFGLLVTDKNEKDIKIPVGEKIELVSRHSSDWKNRRYPDFITIKWKGKELYVGDWNTGGKFNGLIQNLPFDKESPKSASSLLSKKVAGTWALPETPEQLNKLEKIVKDLKNEEYFKECPQKLLWNILGDDIMMDKIDKARLVFHKEILKTVKWFINKLIQNPAKGRLDIDRLTKISKI